MYKIISKYAFVACFKTVCHVASNKIENSEKLLFSESAGQHEISSFFISPSIELISYYLGILLSFYLGILQSFST